jgi:hypothetical protein
MWTRLVELWKMASKRMDARVSLVLDYASRDIERKRERRRGKKTSKREGE